MAMVVNCTFGRCKLNDIKIFKYKIMACKAYITLFNNPEVLFVFYVFYDLIN